ncbi:MAG TPA: AAA family ATPase [Clostridiaceae bacterium]|nr:AAA family ATPase [Clostridiaceae bacterium]
MDSSSVLEALKNIDPAKLDYQEWCSVGMALKDSGYTAADWDEWSRRDPARYKHGECFRKWGSFQGAANPVTINTIFALAKNHGWTPSNTGKELDWDDVIGPKDDLVIIDKAWVEGQEVTEPKEWNPVNQLVKYLETLFEASENVGYVTESWEKDEKHFPTRGCWDRTAGQLIQELSKCKGDIGAVLGDYNPIAGAWIRFNPLDGQGCKNSNVTDYRYALVESDEMAIDKQNAIIRELELPVACLVHSGKKSLHAIVKIEAKSYEEYRKRVDYLYDVCRKNGLKVDSQNKNPSRLSRMPGIMRNGYKQFLVDSNIGKESWAEWQDWIETVNDDLPEPENMATVWDNLPKLSPPLIDGVLRQGHKMLLAGPSKAGKSYALIQLCMAIAEGKKWFDWNCAKGRVMYVNLELDRASCLHRFKDVYQALGWEPDNLKNIDIWNLRGKSVPMDKLAPKLIRRAAKKNYIAIIIDPIYKVITGDENSADQMAHFCNQFDLVCHELGAAVIYCHHHSKGYQGGKRSMDRASGSGVFARDPDALLDLIELDLEEEIIDKEENKAACNVCIDYLNKYTDDWEKKVSQDDQHNEQRMLTMCCKLLKKEQYEDLKEEIDIAKQELKHRTAWRIEGTLREFPRFYPVDIWFEYPIHQVDKCGVLQKQESLANKPPWQIGSKSNKQKATSRANKRKNALENAYNALSINGEVTVSDIAEYLEVEPKTARRHIKEHSKFTYENGIVRRTKP